ncbi:MAG: peroxiredoxin-like family protein [Bacteroidota bacterium]
MSTETKTTLSDQLEEYKAKFSERASEEVKEVYEQGIKELFESGILRDAKHKGEKAPEFELSNAKGKAVKLSEQYETGAVVLTWYRGGWCPYCNLSLKALQNALPKIKGLGANLIALTPETADKSLSTQEKNELEFEVLTDENNEVAKSYGLVFRVPDYVNKFYLNHFDLSEFNGNDSQELPLAATYVINTKGEIVFEFLSADYRERAEPSDIIEALRGL